MDIFHWIGGSRRNVFKESIVTLETNGGKGSIQLSVPSDTYEGYDELYQALTDIEEQLKSSVRNLNEYTIRLDRVLSGMTMQLIMDLYDKAGWVSNVNIITSGGINNKLKRVTEINLIYK